MCYRISRYFLTLFRLNLTFIVASVTANMGALVVGTVLDRFGPKVCGYTSSILLTIGTLLMAFSSSLPFDAFVFGSFFLSLGGAFTFVPSFHLSNAFPKLQGLVLALVTGAFDASAAVMLGFRVLYDLSDSIFGIKSFFLLYLIVPVFILLAQLFIMPDRSYDTRAELEIKLEVAEDPLIDFHDSDEDIEDESELWKIRADRSVRRRESIVEISSILGTAADREDFEKKEEERKEISGVWGALHGVSAWNQIQSPWFILITLLTMLQMARFNFFIATIWKQYEYMLSSEKLATEVNEFFDIALPLGGVLTVPFIGLILDNISTSIVLALIVLLSTVIGVLGAIPTQWAAYCNICLFVVFRPLYYSAMSDYAAKVFGFTTFGTIYGTIICLSGVAIFCQSGLQAIVHEQFQEDPGPMNLWLAGIGLIIGICLVMFVDMRGRVVRQEHAVEDGRKSLLSRSRRTSRSSLRDDDRERRPLLNRNLSTVQERTEPGSPEQSPEREYGTSFKNDSGI